MIMINNASKIADEIYKMCKKNSVKVIMLLLLGFLYKCLTYELISDMVSYTSNEPIKLYTDII